MANFQHQLVKTNNVFKFIPNFDTAFDETLKKWGLYSKKKDQKLKEIKMFEETAKGKEILQKKPPKEDDKKPQEPSRSPELSPEEIAKNRQ